MNAFVCSNGASALLRAATTRFTCTAPVLGRSSAFLQTRRVAPVVGTAQATRRALLFTSMAASRRVAKDGDAVEIHYTGTLDDGTEFDSSKKRGAPLSFIIGSGQVIPGFDDATRGLKVGESTVATIPPDRAYGERDDQLIVTIPRSSAPEGMKLQAGMKVPLTNGAMATILDANNEEIKMDANHELAGKTLTFDMKLVSFSDTVLSAPVTGLQRLVCAAGCFWGIGEFMRREIVLSSWQIIRDVAISHRDCSNMNCCLPLPQSYFSNAFLVLCQRTLATHKERRLIRSIERCALERLATQRPLPWTLTHP
jgi:peptidylprolyl isomerase